MRKPKDPSNPTLADVLDKRIAMADGPLRVDEVIDYVLAHLESKAKKPRANVRTKLAEMAGRNVVFLDNDTVMSQDIALRGVRFRVRLTKDEIKLQGIDTTHTFRGYVSGFMYGRSNKPIHLMDRDGMPIKTDVVTGKAKLGLADSALAGILGVSSEQNVDYIDLSDWLRTHKARQGDHLIFTVENWAENRLSLVLQPERDVREDAIAQRNKVFTDALYAMLDQAREERLYNHVAIPTVYARLNFQGLLHGEAGDQDADQTGDHWMTALAQDERFAISDYDIRYSDGGPLSLIDLIAKMTDERGSGFQARPFAREQGRQVYHFRAQAQFSKNKSCDIFVRGKDTLLTLDETLREAFNHEFSDHLGGFWLLLPRGGPNTKRYREVNIGVVAPGGAEIDDDVSGVAIAGLNLSAGARIKYVYDLGDWLEHLIELVEVSEPVSDTSYPHVVSHHKQRKKNE